MTATEGSLTTDIWFTTMNLSHSTYLHNNQPTYLPAKHGSALIYRCTFRIFQSQGFKSLVK